MYQRLTSAPYQRIYDLNNLFAHIHRQGYLLAAAINLSSLYTWHPFTYSWMETFILAKRKIANAPSLYNYYRFPLMHYITLFSYRRVVARLMTSVVYTIYYLYNSV